MFFRLELMSSSYDTSRQSKYTPLVDLVILGQMWGKNVKFLRNIRNMQKIFILGNWEKLQPLLIEIHACR